MFDTKLVARILILARVGICRRCDAHTICSVRARVPLLCRFPVGGNHEFLRGAESTDVACRQRLRCTRGVDAFVVYTLHPRGVRSRLRLPADRRQADPDPWGEG
jgi:hypothetical protein